MAVWRQAFCARLPASTAGPERFPIRNKTRPLTVGSYFFKKIPRRGILLAVKNNPRGKEAFHVPKTFLHREIPSSAKNNDRDRGISYRGVSSIRKP